jgi:hypothetical protein
MISIAGTDTKLILRRTAKPEGRFREIEECGDRHRGIRTATVLSRVPRLIMVMSVGRGPMPRSIVDFSAISPIIRDEPFLLHFWESTPLEALEFLKNPRAELVKMGIDLPPDCRVETTLENHDWLAAHSDHLTRDNGTIICGTGGGNTAKNYYKISLYAHDKSDVGKYRKTLLHGENERERK